MTPNGADEPFSGSAGTPEIIRFLRYILSHINRLAESIGSMSRAACIKPYIHLRGATPRPALPSRSPQDMHN
jgi:hypothetical protein